MIQAGFAALLLLSLTACGQLPYYVQAAGGQLDVTIRRHGVAALLAREETPAALKKQLTLATALNRFAIDELLLPENDGYRSYADLERPYATWVVFATGPFSLIPREWCFPVSGCLGYRGYFNPADAETFASQLRGQSLDVFVTGSPAYSTLGWFDDPLLNTFIHWPEAELAALMFHELAHARVYLPGDTEFNESYAEAVSRAGVERWLRRRGRDGAVEVFRQHLKEDDDFVRWANQTRGRLETLYASGLPSETMRARKKALLGRAAAELEGGRFAAFGQGLNNAKLASVNTYNRWVPAFLRLLGQQDGDMAAFHRQAALLAKQPEKERQERLTMLTQQNGP